MHSGQELAWQPGEVSSRCIIWAEISWGLRGRAAQQNPRGTLNLCLGSSGLGVTDCFFLYYAHFEVKYQLQ